MDLNFEITDIKQGQQKMLTLLNGLVEGNSQPKIYDLVDLTKILHVSKRTILTWKQNGILPHSQVGGKIWITEAQLSEFLAKHSSNQLGSKKLFKF